MALAALFFLPTLGQTSPESTAGEAFKTYCESRGTLCMHPGGFVSQVPMPTGAVLVLVALSFQRRRL